MYYRKFQGSLTSMSVLSLISVIVHEKRHTTVIQQRTAVVGTSARFWSKQLHPGPPWSHAAGVMPRIARTPRERTPL